MKCNAIVYIFILLYVLIGSGCKINKLPSGPLSIIPVKKPIKEAEVYSKNINIGKLEAFDVDNKGNIYYAILGDLEKIKKDLLKF